MINGIDQTDSGWLTYNIQSTDTFAYCYMIFVEKAKQLRKLPIFLFNLVRTQEKIVFLKVTFPLSFFEKGKWRHNRIKLRLQTVALFS